MRTAVLVLVVGAALAWFVHTLHEPIARFEAVDERMASMLPKDRGLAPTPTFTEDFLKVTVRLSRRDHDQPAEAYTHVALQDGPAFALPKGWRGRAQETPARIEAYDGVMAAIRGVIRKQITAGGYAPQDVKGEIVAPPPEAGAVPHGDVVSMLNVFLTAGLVDIVFDGPAPRDARTKDDR